MVIPEYERLIRSKIAKFLSGEDAEDCFQSMVLQLITPSKSLGTTYLERYDPARSSAANYLSMFCTQLLSKWSRRTRALPDTLPIVYGTVEDIHALTGHSVPEETLPDETEPPRLDVDVIRTPDDLRSILAGTRFLKVTSCSPDGEPRSTFKVLELLVWEGLSPREVGERLGVTPAEVYRRIGLLRRHPRIQALREGRLAPP